MMYLQKSEAESKQRNSENNSFIKVNEELRLKLVNRRASSSVKLTENCTNTILCMYLGGSFSFHKAMPNSAGRE